TINRYSPSILRFDLRHQVLWDGCEIAAYVPDAWQTRLIRGSQGHSESGIPVTQPFCDPRKKNKLEGFTTPEATLEWMDAHHIEHAVLNSFHAPSVSNFGDADYPARLAEAYNRWLVDHWLERSDRFFGSIVVANQNPEAAASEIRRAAESHPRITQVLLSAGTLQPYGKRYYWPIYKAAAECNLAVAIHGGTEGVAVSNPPSSHGWPRNLLEYRVCPVTNFISHFTSMVTEGVFTEFSNLHLVGLEVGGVLPLITYLWRFDKNYKALRSECPWVTELPSEVAHRHVRLGTQSTAIGDPGVYFSLLKSFKAAEMLLWTSNAPRWDKINPALDQHLETTSNWDPQQVTQRTPAKLYESRIALTFSNT
ncbi:MAG: amidohydrolase family protein, partial [Opitutales bacterium]|nr:amidohydrolase family protein [Opitutales bacterium]